MSESSFNGTGTQQQSFLDQLGSAGSNSSQSTGGLERTDDANFSGTHSCSYSHSVDMQQYTGREARRSEGKTTLAIPDHFDKDDDRPQVASVPRPASTKRYYPALRISACRSAPEELAADSMQIPRDHCDMRKVAPAYIRESRRRSRRAEFVESSESEAEAIAVRRSKWVTYGMHPVKSSRETEEPRRTIDCCGSSGLPNSTRSRCIESTDGTNQGSYTGHTEGSDIHPLDNTGLLNISELFEAASTQLARAGNTERPWMALELGDDQSLAESLEQKVAAWDPCQEDSYALSPPGELELFELDMFDPRRTRRPKVVAQKPEQCCVSKPWCLQSPTSPPKIKKLLPVKVADSRIYEDLNWFIDSREKSDSSSLKRELATTAGTSSPKAEQHPAGYSTNAGSSRWQTSKEVKSTKKSMAPFISSPAARSFSPPENKLQQECTDKSIAGPSKAAPVKVKTSSQPSGASNHTGRRGYVSTHALRPPLPDGLEKLNWVPAVESLQSAGQMASGTEDDKQNRSDARNDETDVEEPALRIEQKCHHKQGKKKHHRKKKSTKLKKKEHPKTSRSTQDDTVLLTLGQHGQSTASPESKSDAGSSRKDNGAAVPAVAPAASASTNPDPEYSADEVTHPDDGTISICIKTSMRTRSGLVWPFSSLHDC
ncbi:hypothetical protein MRX96_052276 [Rhipicephalus microplus]